MKININAEEVKRALDLLKPNDELFEIRGIKGKENISGYFTNAENAINALESYNFRDTANWQIYFSLNKINTACYSREQCNKFISSNYGNKLITTSDNDILHYEWILLDFDTERPSGTSSSNEELEKSHQKAVKIYQTLKEYGFGEPVTALSGNGYHLLYKVNFENTPENVQLVKSFLGTLNRLFSDNMVKIDTSVFNPARICKLYGTIAAKGTPTAERPHRQAKILTVPAELSETSRDLLQSFVNEHEQTKEKTNNRRLPQRYSGTSFNLADWLSVHNVPIRSTDTKNGDNYYILENCPFNPEHTGKDSAVIQKSDGTLCFNCFHDSCSEKTWKDFRLFYEPTAYDKKNNGYNVSIGETSNNIEQNAAAAGEYENIIELAKVNVLDRAVIEYASRFNDLSNFDFFYAEIMPLADFQRKKTDFKALMNGIRKGIEKQQKPEKQPFTIEVLQQFLNEHNIVIRENAITHEIEADNLPKEYDFDGSSAHLGTILYSELKKANLSAAQNVIENYTMVISKQNCYNPVAEKLKGKAWDGKDRFKELFEIMHISKTFQKKLIKKWLMQALTISLYNSEKMPISAEGVLVLVGEQAIGKTSLVRKLGIDNRLCKTGLSLDCKNKDSVITAVSCFIGELGELESTFKSDIQALKAFFTQEFDTLRKPYGRSYEKVTRRSVYIATCNSKEFLIDETGNRRYWTIDCEQRFELDKLQKLDEVQLWLQVYDLIQKHGKQAFRLSPEELKELNTHNEKHEKKLKGQQEIEDILSKESDDNYKIVYELMTTTDFKNEWDRELKAYSASVIGKVLDKLGYEAETVKCNGKTAKLRRLPKQLCYPTAKN